MAPSASPHDLVVRVVWTIDAVAALTDASGRAVRLDAETLARG